MSTPKKLVYGAMTAALTSVLKNAGSFTCMVALHQPKMPAEFNDFKKYKKS